MKNTHVISLRCGITLLQYEIRHLAVDIRYLDLGVIKYLCDYSSGVVMISLKTLSFIYYFKKPKACNLIAQKALGFGTYN